MARRSSYVPRERQFSAGLWSTTNRVNKCRPYYVINTEGSSLASRMVYSSYSIFHSLTVSFYSSSTSEVGMSSGTRIKSTSKSQKRAQWGELVHQSNRNENHYCILAFVRFKLFTALTESIVPAYTKTASKQFPGVNYP